MKTIRIQLDDTVHTRLRALCTHHGELSHLIRQGIRLIVQLKEDQLAKLHQGDTRDGQETL